MKVTINIPSMREQKKILSFIEVIMEKNQIIGLKFVLLNHNEHL